MVRIILLAPDEIGPLSQGPLEGIHGGGMFDGWGSGRVEGKKIEKKPTADSGTGRAGFPG